METKRPQRGPGQDQQLFWVGGNLLESWVLGLALQVQKISGVYLP